MPGPPQDHPTLNELAKCGLTVIPAATGDSLPGPKVGAWPNHIILIHITAECWIK